MFLFIVRRLLIAIPILILSSVLVFVLVVNAGDPLENLRSRPNSQQLIAAEDGGVPPRPARRAALPHLGQGRPPRRLRQGRHRPGGAAEAHARPLDHHAAGHRRRIHRGGARHHRGGDQRHPAVHPVRLRVDVPRLPVLRHARVLVRRPAQGVRRHQAEQLARAPGPLRLGRRHHRRHLRRSGVHHLQHRREALPPAGPDRGRRRRRVRHRPRRRAGHLVRRPHLHAVDLHDRARVARTSAARSSPTSATSPAT